MLLREISKEEFLDFTKNFVLESVYQTVEYAEVMKEQKYGIFFIGGFKNEMVAASLILVERHKNYNYALAPRGILMNYNDKPLLEEFTKELKNFLNSHDIIAIKLAPLIVRNVINKDGKIIATNPDFDSIFNHLKTLGYRHLGFNAFFEALKPRFDAIIDLSVGYENLFKNIKKEYKTKIRTAGRRGIQIFKATEEEINILYDQVKNKYPRDIKYFEDTYKIFSQTDKIDFYYAKLDTEIYLKTLQEEYANQEKLVLNLNDMILKNRSQNSGKLLSRKLDADRQFSDLKEKLIDATNIVASNPEGAVLASALVSKGKNEVFLLMDGYNPMYKTFSAKHLVIWKIIEKYSGLNYRLFNMGGIADIRVKNKKFDGLNNFKACFNPSIIEYAGDFELVSNSTKYFLYKQTRKK